MKATSTPVTPAAVTTRLRNALIAATFGVILLIPKALQLRRSPQAWLTFRILLALTGAALVLVPLSLWNGLFTAVAGLIMFLAAILLPSPSPVDRLSEKAKELQTLVIVNGGEYQSGAAPRIAAQLFVAADNIWVLDSHLRPLLVIPITQIVSTKCAESQPQTWTLRVAWFDQVAAEHTAAFDYRGIFAEHFARVAESTIRGLMRPALPVLPQKQAARA